MVSFILCYFWLTLTELMNVVTYECRRLGLTWKLKVSWILVTRAKLPSIRFLSEEVIICRKPDIRPLPPVCAWMNFNLNVL